MSDFVKRARGKLDRQCLVKGRLIKDGCKVSLANAPEPRLIVDFDKPGSPLGPESTRCDYLFLAGDKGDVSWVVPLELKRGSLDVDQVVRQLQGGASAAEKLIPQKEAIKLRPVVASGNMPKAAREQLKHHWIRLHEHKERIQRMKCGAPLAPALGS